MLLRKQDVRANEDFASFYHETRDKCLRAVYASTGDVHRAEDLVAEAYARALSRWPRVSRHPAPAAWIVRTALNLHVSWWRRRRREYAIGLPEGTVEQLVAVAGASRGYPPAGGWAGGEALPDPVLIAALRSLPRRQREVVVLRVLLDLDTATTARGYLFGPPSDDDAIAAVAGSFSGLHMDRGIDPIARRARALSARRRAVPAAAAANPGAASTIGNLQLTGFTVQKDPSSGMVTVTVKNFDDSSGLIAALAKDGIKVQIYYQNNIPAKAVEQFGKAMGYTGDTYYTGVPWTKLSDGTYQVQINPKALGPGHIQPLIVVQGYK